MQRDWKRPTPVAPFRTDRFHIETRRLKDFRVKVTMWEIGGLSMGGELDKTVVILDDMVEVIEMITGFDRDLLADGWERV